MLYRPLPDAFVSSMCLSLLRAARHLVKMQLLGQSFPVILCVPSILIKLFRKQLIAQIIHKRPIAANLGAAAMDLNHGVAFLPPICHFPGGSAPSHWDNWTDDRVICFLPRATLLAVARSATHSLTISAGTALSLVVTAPRYQSLISIIHLGANIRDLRRWAYLCIISPLTFSFLFIVL
jgi:hypothetical protein